MIENISLYAHGLDIGLGFRHVWTKFSCLNNNNIFYYFIFESISVYTVVIFETVCLFSNIYICIVPHSWKTTFEKHPRENIFVHSFELKREKETEYFAEHGSCVSLLCAVDHFILGGKRLWISKHHRLWVVKSALRRFCQTQDLIWIIHSSCIWSMSF